MSSASATQVTLEEFDNKIKSTVIEVSSASLGAKILSVSDEFFESASNLLKVGPSQSLKGQFGPSGARYDGWETRRHNPTFDWCIISLGPIASTLRYVDIDTSHFIGNEGPEAEVLGLWIDKKIEDEAKLKDTDSRWDVVCEKVELGPGSRHIFKLGGDSARKFSHLMLRMIPDGGFARFRAYGLPLAPTPPPLASIPTSTTGPNTPQPIDLASVLLSARAIAASDANFAPPSDLLLPGRGHDMSDGWETRRSRIRRGQPDRLRVEWAIIKLASTGTILYTEVDSAWHVGNYPVACTLEATLSDADVPAQDAEWTPLVSKQWLGPHRQHWFKADVSPRSVWSHVRISIFPDGGLKRLRVFGYPSVPEPAATASIDSLPPTLQLLPLTVEAFKPYGHVIQAFGLPTSAPKGTKVSIANQGTAFKYHKLAPVKHTYPEGLLKNGALSIGLIRAKPLKNVGDKVEVRMLERHKHTSQAFVPMGKGAPKGVEPLPQGGAYVVIAALNGPDDQPIKSTLKAFLATQSQGVSYNQGIWHHSMMTVEAPLDYAAIEAQIGEAGNQLDCETRRYEDTPFAYLDIPSDFTGVPQTVAAPAPAPTAKPFTLSSLLPRSSSAPIPCEPITSAAFAEFGQVIQAYPDPAKRPAGQVVFGGPPALAEKYMWLAHCEESYPKPDNMAISVFRSTVKEGLERGKPFDLHHMERHLHTTQAFIPMGKPSWNGKGEDALPEGGSMIVVVAKNGPDDRPDPSTTKAFIVESSQGINYAAGVWHHPALTLDSTLDYAVVEAQLATDGSEPSDCDLLEYSESFARILVPEA